MFKKFNLKNSIKIINSKLKILLHVILPWKNLSKKRQRALTGIALIIIVVGIPASIYILKHAGVTEAAWFNANWSFRQRVDVTNSGSAQTDFQVSFTLNTDTLFDNGKLRSDCNDIRVTDVNGKLLPYWIEQMATACGNGQTAQTVWVKMPSISTTGNTLYVYYGNPQASSYSDGNKVFEFFDDFSGSSIDAGKWSQGTIAATSGTNFSQSAGTLAGGNTNRYIQSVRTFSGNYTAQTRVYTTTSPVNGYSTVGFYASSTNSFGILDHNTTSYYRNDSGWTNFTYNGTGQWNRDITTVVGTSASYSRTGETSGSSTASGITNSGISSEYIRLSARYDDSAFDQNYTATWDWVFVRKAVSTPPNAAAPANEENGPGPVAYWKFDEGTGTSAKDSTTNNNTGTLTNMSSTPATNSGWMKDDACIKGKCLAFDGGNDYVSMGDQGNLEGLSVMSISAWIRPNSIPSAEYFIAGKEGIYKIDITANGKIRFLTGNNWAGSILTTNKSISTNQWTHIEATYDGTTKKVYINGIQDTATVTTSGGVGSNTAQVSVGAYDAAGTFLNFFPGLIDDVRIHRYARSAAQIKVDYNSRGGSGGSVLGESDSNKNLTNGLVGYWKMDETSWTGDCATKTALDSSGNNNNGLACPNASAPVATGSGKFGNAGYYDGVNDYVDAGTSSTLDFATSNTSFSLAAWFKARTANSGSSSQNIISRGACGTAGYRLRLETTGEARFFINSSGGVIGTVTTSGTYNDNTWHHVVGVNNNGTLYIYVDGDYKGTATATSGQSIASPANVAIGYDFSTGTVGCGTEYFSGNIDESRIYNRALSDREVKQLYNFAPGPVAYYDFEEKSGTSVADKSGSSNNGTWNGTGGHFTTGKYGGAGNFNGTNDYVNVTDSNSLDITSGITISAWVKLTDVTAYRQVVAKNSTGSGYNDPYELRVNITTGKVDARVGNGGAQENEIIGNTNVADGTWHHIAMTRDTDSLKVYVDGKQDATPVTSTLTMFSNATDLRIGNWQGASFYHKGQIDEVKIYNYARTAGQIIEDMNASHPAPGSPVGSPLVHLKLDDGFGNVASNSGNIGGLANGGMHNMANPATVASGWSQNGKFGRALAFDGVNDYVNLGSSSSVDNLANNDFTTSAWIKMTAHTTNSGDTYYRSRIIEKRGEANGQGWIFAVVDNKDLQLTTVDASGADAQYTSSANTVVLNQWVHATAVYYSSTKTIKLYANGREVSYSAQSVGNGTSFDDSASNLFIGDSVASAENRYFTGLIDEVKIYNSALTAEQIRLDYNRASTQVLGSLSDTSGLTGGSVASNSASAEYCVPGDSGTCSAPVAEWSFEEGAGNTTNDKSGNNINGTLSNAPTRTTGKVGKALSFNGSNQGVTLPATSALDLQNLTIEAWAYSSNFVQNGFIFEKTTNGTVNTQYSCFFSNDSSNTIYFRTYNSVSTQDNLTVSFAASGLTNNRWNHIVCRYDGSTKKIFVNGIEVATKAYSQTLITNAAGTSSIGQFVGGGYYLNGKLDQVRVFGYSRSHAQIAWDYNQGESTGHYKFDECQGATINNSLVGTTSGTLTVGASGTQAAIGTCATASTAWGNGATGRLNYSINLDGTDDYVSIPDADWINDFPNNHDFSVALWMKAPATQVDTSAIVGAVMEKWSGSGGYPYTIRLYNQTHANNGKIEVLRWDGSNNPGITSTKTVNDNSWHHVVYLKRGSTLYLYIDGKQNGTTTDTTTGSTTNTSAIYVGRRGDGSTKYNGQVDDFKVFNYGLTASQVRTLYNNGAVNFGPSTGAP